MLKTCETGSPILFFVLWDAGYYDREREHHYNKQEKNYTLSYEVVYNILIVRWSKKYTHLYDPLSES